MPIPFALVAGMDREKKSTLSVDQYWPRTTSAERDALRPVLHWDMTSEYDARFLDAYLRSGAIELSPLFLAREAIWAEDEERHHEGFRAVWDCLFGGADEILASRTPEFGPVAHLFEDEFAICCLLAYDELATVRGYRVNLPLYDRLGPELGAFVREVIADEGRHYGAFLSVLREQHAERLHEAPAVVARIRATEGTPYASTFILDHDEDLYTDQIFDEAQTILLRHLASWTRRRESVA